MLTDKAASGMYSLNACSDNINHRPVSVKHSREADNNQGNNQGTVSVKPK